MSIVYYSSNPLNEQGQFRSVLHNGSTSSTVSHFSTSSKRKWCPFVRRDNRKKIKFLAAFSFVV